MKKKSLLIFFTLILLKLLSINGVCEVSAQKYKKKKIAVLSITPHNASKSAARIIRNKIELKLFKSGAYEILEREQIDFVLKEKKIKTKLSYDKNDASKIGELISADYVIIGSLEKLEQYNVIIKVIEVSRNRLVITETQKIENVKQFESKAAVMADNIHKKLLKLFSGREGFNYQQSSLYFGADNFFVKPISTFKNRMGDGYGISVSGGIESFLLNNLSLGVRLALFNFDGDNQTTHHARMLPIIAEFAYKFKFNNLYLKPLAGPGIGYNSNSYYKYTSGNKYYTNSSFQFMTNYGAEIAYSLNDYLNFKISTLCFQVHERSNTYQFVAYGAGVGFSF